MTTDTVDLGPNFSVPSLSNDSSRRRYATRERKPVHRNESLLDPFEIWEDDNDLLFLEGFANEASRARRNRKSSTGSSTPSSKRRKSFEGEDSDEGFEEWESAEAAIDPRAPTGRLNITLQDMMRAGLLQVGDLLSHKNEQAVLSASGEIEYLEKTYRSISDWCTAVARANGSGAGTRRSGWDEVECRGKTLKQIKTEYITMRAKGEIKEACEPDSTNGNGNTVNTTSNIVHSNAQVNPNPNTNNTNGHGRVQKAPKPKAAEKKPRKPRRKNTEEDDDDGEWSESSPVVPPRGPQAHNRPQLVQQSIPHNHSLNFKPQTYATDMQKLERRQSPSMNNQLANATQMNIRSASATPPLNMNRGNYLDRDIPMHLGLQTTTMPSPGMSNTMSNSMSSTLQNQIATILAANNNNSTNSMRMQFGTSLVPTQTASQIPSHVLGMSTPHSPLTFQAPQRQPTPQPQTTAAIQAINSSQLTFSGETVGSGKYGVIFRYEWQDTDVAIQRVSRDRFFTEWAQRTDFIHPNIVTLYGHCTLNQEMYMVTEFMNCGTLHDFIANGGTSLLKDPRMYYYIARNIAKVLTYLHSKGKILRDLTSKSILLRALVTQVGIMNLEVKLGDLGVLNDETALAMFAADESGYYRNFLAPELRGERPMFSAKSDVYAYGVVLCHLFCEGKPLSHLTEILTSSQIIKMNGWEELLLSWMPK